MYRNMLTLLSHDTRDSHFIIRRQRPSSHTLSPYTTLFRSRRQGWPQMPADDELTGAVDWIPVEFNRSEEHTSELQSRLHLVCRFLLEKKNLSFGVVSRGQRLCCRKVTRWVLCRCADMLLRR